MSVGRVVFVATRNAVGDGMFVDGTRDGDGVAVAGTRVDVAVAGGRVGDAGRVAVEATLCVAVGVLVGADVATVGGVRVDVNEAIGLGTAFCTEIAVAEALGEDANVGPAKSATVIHASENARISRRRNPRPRRAEPVCV